ncbi:hypothetical protein HX004_00370 [Myroides sp. 1354]|uniref:DUF6909 family protein n=1 Tax=unclassified Myroides TaxID=2642485 RepID=UPI0025749928|nr:MULTISPECIES: hypothetical protein [unclassified Myroides]MDM1043709.1 hypothetical protein [Myroides sp. R163-1]MDM1054241.1 hypothetical protein [Myroides sp. 1354]MDM1067537.1 hypothetical protein [Myroides sp. 1372]
MREIKNISRTRAQVSSAAIERIYITMRHLFNRGFYKPMGVSGDTLREALLELRPEIYGTIAEEKVELDGLLYVIERLPIGIEECRYINLTSDEGYAFSHFQALVPPKRRRNCYRIDEEQMNIEITRGRSDIYDVLTHLTFIFIESHKIKNRVLIDEEGKVTRDWKKIELAAKQAEPLELKDKEVTMSHLANVLGRSFAEVLTVYEKFAIPENPDRFLDVIYWLGRLAIEEEVDNNKRTITFSPLLRERLGHHIYGEIWSNRIKEVLVEKGLLERPIHIISANMHSVMNSIFAPYVMQGEIEVAEEVEIYEELSKPENKVLRNLVRERAEKEGMVFLSDDSGTNIDVQIFDSAKIKFEQTNFKGANFEGEHPVIIVMDYAFGEQAYETIDELLKPYKKQIRLNVESVSIMGKAGILEGGKGDIMIPFAHINEGTGDNYPFDNELTVEMFENQGIPVVGGTMVTVLGTSLQNKDLLKFFHDSTWGVIGLEMEGAHYQKAIQSASRIRKSINPDVKVRYAYYASDNPLETGSTLASGGLGTTGVKPTYLITIKILEQIFNSN